MNCNDLYEPTTAALSRIPIRSRSFTSLEQVQSNPMFQDTPIPVQLKIIRDTLDYQLIDSAPKLSPAAALHELQRQEADMPGIKLKRIITPGDENGYRVDLIQSHEQVKNQMQRMLVTATAFLGHLKAGLDRLSKRTPSSIWWSIPTPAPQDDASNSNQNGGRGLLIIAAVDQFNIAVDATKVELAAIVKATALLIANLKSSLKQADATYQFGLDQINKSPSDSRIQNAGTPGRAATTQSSATETPRHSVGDPVPEPTRTKVEENDPEQSLMLPPELEAAEPAPAEIAGQSEAMGNGHSIVVNPAPQLNVDLIDPDSGLEPQLPAQPAMVAAAPVEPLLLKVRNNGDPLPVDFNISLLAPGITGKHDGVILRKGNSKLKLTAQANPAENGVYRWMGGDQPLVLMVSPTKAKAKAAAPVSLDTPEPPKVVEVDTTAVTKAEAGDPFNLDDEDEVLPPATGVVAPASKEKSAGEWLPWVVSPAGAAAMLTPSPTKQVDPRPSTFFTKIDYLIPPTPVPGIPAAIPIVAAAPVEPAAASGDRREGDGPTRTEPKDGPPSNAAGDANEGMDEGEAPPIPGPAQEAPQTTSAAILSPADAGGSSSEVKPEKRHSPTYIPHIGGAISRQFRGAYPS